MSVPELSENEIYEHVPGYIFEYIGRSTSHAKLNYGDIVMMTSIGRIGQPSFVILDGENQGDECGIIPFPDTVKPLGTFTELCNV